MDEVTNQSQAFEMVTDTDRAKTVGKVLHAVGINRVFLFDIPIDANQPPDRSQRHTRDISLIAFYSTPHPSPHLDGLDTGCGMASHDPVENRHGIPRSDGKNMGS